LLPLRLRADALLGRHALNSGERVSARRLLEGAADGFEALRGGLAHDALLRGAASDAVAVLDDLVRLEVLDAEPDAASRCLALIERARSRALDDLITGVTSTRSGDADPELRSLQAELSAVYTTLFESTGRDPAAVHEVRLRATELEQKLSRLRVDQAEVRRSHLIERKVAGSRATHADTAIVSYGRNGEDVIALVSLPGGAVEMIALGPAAEVIEAAQRLDAQWDRFRLGEGFAVRHRASLEQSCRRVLAQLYDLLVRPFDALLADVDSVVFIPFGVLHRVPFQALHDGSTYLIESHIVTTAPSIALFERCELVAATRSGRGRSLVVGVADAVAPNVVAESIAIADATSATLLLGEQATGDAVLAALGRADIVHFACHGVFRADNPMFSALKLHDRWLTAIELLDADLEGSLVVLSACESARIGGGEEILGITRAILGARAGSLVASQWAADDAITAELMSAFHVRVSADGPARALRHAQLALLGRGLHPYYWAPFTVIGAR
jgi:CHAT domain-containing protein